MNLFTKQRVTDAEDKLMVTRRERGRLRVLNRTPLNKITLCFRVVANFLVDSFYVYKMEEKNSTNS